MLLFNLKERLWRFPRLIACAQVTFVILVFSLVYRFPIYTAFTPLHRNLLSEQPWFVVGIGGACALSLLLLIVTRKLASWLPRLTLTVILAGTFLNIVYVKQLSLIKRSPKEFYGANVMSGVNLEDHVVGNNEAFFQSVKIYQSLKKWYDGTTIYTPERSELVEWLAWMMAGMKLVPKHYRWRLSESEASHLDALASHSSTLDPVTYGRYIFVPSEPTDREFRIGIFQNRIYFIPSRIKL